MAGAAVFPALGPRHALNFFGGGFFPGAAALGAIYDERLSVRIQLSRTSQILHFSFSIAVWAHLAKRID